MTDYALLASNSNEIAQALSHMFGPDPEIDTWRRDPAQWVVYERGKGPYKVPRQFGGFNDIPESDFFFGDSATAAALVMLNPNELEGQAAFHIFTAGEGDYRYAYAGD